MEIIFSAVSDSFFKFTPILKINQPLLQSIFETFLQNSVGVADHDKFMSILKDRVDKLSHAKDSLKTVKDIMEKKVPIVEENKCKCKKEK